MLTWQRPIGAGDQLRRAVRGVMGACLVRPGWALLVLATLALTLAAAGDGVLPGDVAIQQAIQELDVPGGGYVAAAVNTIGGTLGTCLIAAAIAWWCARRGHGAAAVVVFGALMLRGGNALIKLPVGSPRPSDESVRVMEEANGYGFPSAHVMGVVLLFGAVLLLAPELIRCRARRRLVQSVALLMLLTIGFGRIHAGAHWPSDVLGAYLYGMLGLAGLLALYRALQAGRLRGPESAVRVAVGRLSEFATAAVRFLSPGPLARRSDIDLVPIRVARDVHRQPRRKR